MSAKMSRIKELSRLFGTVFKDWLKIFQGNFGNFGLTIEVLAKVR